MAKRYENRYGRGGHRRDRDYADDRGYMDRAADEVRSWFGDDDAERRRRRDEERDRERERRYGSPRDRGDWNRGDEHRSDWQRHDANRGDWNQRDWSRDDPRRDDWRDAGSNRGAPSRPENWRGGYRDDASRYDDWGRTWAVSDWDRDRGSMRDRDTWDRDRSWSGGERDWSTRDRDRDRDWQDRSWRDRDPMNRFGGSVWSADEGRAQFGAVTPPGTGFGTGRESARWGRGPKGYQRSDSRIHEDICERLTFSDVDAENIEVTVSNGEVSLAGSVRERWDKRRAEDLAEEVAGVREVHNSIRVERPDRGIGQSNASASDQPGSVLGVNPTAEANITSDTPSSRPGGRRT